MWDFQYRAAMDAYEQLNGRIKVPATTYEPASTPAKPGLLHRILQALFERHPRQPSDKATVCPNMPPRTTQIGQANGLVGRQTGAHS